MQDGGAERREILHGAGAGPDGRCRYRPKGRIARPAVSGQMIAKNLASPRDSHEEHGGNSVTARLHFSGRQGVLFRHRRFESGVVWWSIMAESKLQ
jgi:hypothetical protein